MIKHARLMTAAALATGAMMLSGCAQNRQEYTIQRDTIDGLPSVVATGYVRAEVKVQAVDYVNHSIALAGPDGVTHIFAVDTDVPRFNEIKAGDTVKVRYNTRVAISVLKVGEEPSSMQFMSRVPAEKSEKPGIECTRHGRIVAMVETIDYPSRIVTLRPASGAPITVRASDKLKNLERVRVGDQVAINYTESLSIAVD